MESSFEEHTHRASAEMIDWVGNVLWSVWDWRARWASARRDAYYAALDQESEQSNTDVDPGPPTPDKVPCLRCSGHIIAVTPETQKKVLNTCDVCQRGIPATHIITCSTEGCRAGMICYYCIKKTGVWDRMRLVNPNVNHIDRAWVIEN